MANKDGIRMFSHWAIGVAEFEHGKKRMVSFEFTMEQQGDTNHVMLEPEDARDLADQLESLNVDQLVQAAQALRYAAKNAELHIFALSGAWP